MVSLYSIINSCRDNAGLPNVAITPTLSLRRDLGFDSLELAVLTVRIEAVFGVDVFADGLVDTIGELQAKLEAKGCGS